MPYGGGALVVPPGGGTSATVEFGYPASAYGLSAMSGDPSMFQGTAPPGSSIIWYQRLPWPANKPITNVYVAVATAGTWDGLTTPNQIGVYDDTGAKLGATADDGTLWTAVGWRGGAVVGGPLTAPTTDGFVYLAALLRGMTVTNFAYPANAGDTHAPWVSIGPTNGNRRTAYQGAVTALPASITPTTVGTSTGYTLLCGFN